MKTNAHMLATLYGNVLLAMIEFHLVSRIMKIVLAHTMKVTLKPINLVSTKPAATHHGSNNTGPKTIHVQKCQTITTSISLTPRTTRLVHAQTRLFVLGLFWWLLYPHPQIALRLDAFCVYSTTYDSRECTHKDPS